MIITYKYGDLRKEGYSFNLNKINLKSFFLKDMRGRDSSMELLKMEE